MLSMSLSCTLEKSAGADLSPHQLSDLAGVSEQRNYCLVGLFIFSSPSILKINMDQMAKIHTLPVCAAGSYTVTVIGKHMEWELIKIRWANGTMHLTSFTDVVLKVFSDMLENMVIIFYL